MDTLGIKDYFSVPEAAEILGVSRVTVFNWIKQGSLKAAKIGRSYAISHEELMKRLESRPLTEEEKAAIRATVDRAVADYGETIRMLAKE